MSVSDAERLLRLMKDVNSKSAPADVAGTAVAALELVRRIQEDLSACRDDAICALNRSGESLQEISQRTGLSRARIHQIIKAAVAR